MKEKKYAFDIRSLSIKKVTASAGSVFWKAVRFLLASVAFSILFYVLFALVFSTPEERRLYEENRAYSKTLPELSEREALLEPVIKGLQARDNTIYEGIFQTEAPAPDAIDFSGIISGSDSLTSESFLAYSSSKAESVMRMSDRVEESFREIFDALVDRRDSIPPLQSPVAGVTHTRTGASVGMKKDPLLRIDVFHSGVDLVYPPDEPVYATADGTVREASRAKGIVEIDHGNGYTTRYTLLGSVVVSKGAKVKAGTKIGDVGISRGSFAPHLHYEVLRGGKVVDPVDYMFASLTPEEYSNMLFMSVSTGQLLD